VIQVKENLLAVAKRPLSSVQGRRLHFDSGRVCVMLSRLKLCFILLVRGNMETILGDYEHYAGERLLGREGFIWQGCSAHHSFWRTQVDKGCAF
jgi:hypothetical protein